MEILSFFVTKILVFAFVLAILFLLSEVLRFVRGLNTGEYSMTSKKLLWIGLAISYVLTLLITGFII